MRRFRRLCVCVFGKTGWKWACNTLKTTPTLWPFTHTHTHTHTRGLVLCFLMTLVWSATRFQATAPLIPTQQQGEVGRGGPRWDRRCCHLLKNLIHYCSSQMTHQFVNTPAWNSRSVYLSTYRHTANIPHGARNPKHLLTRQLLLLPVAFWGLPDQKSLGRQREMAAADIMKWTPHKAADLSVYNAPHGGSGSFTVRFWQPYASSPGFPVPAQTDSRLWHPGSTI